MTSNSETHSKRRKSRNKMMQIIPYENILFCWLTLQGSTTGTLIGTEQAEETFHALA